MDEELRQRIQDRFYRNQERSLRSASLLQLVDAAMEERIPITWQLLHDFSSLLTSGHDATIQVQVLELFRSVTGQLGGRALLDPFARAPALIAGVVEGTPRSAGTAIVPSRDVYEAISRLTDPPIQWVHSDPISGLEQLAEQEFDLIVSSPPPGYMHAVELRGGEPAYLREELGDLVLYRSTRLLSATGVMLAVVADGFLSGKRRLLWESWSDERLYLRAVVSLGSGAYSGMSIPMSLVVFEREQRGSVFLGRLDPGIAVTDLARNLEAHSEGDRPELGVLVDRNQFVGWEGFVRQRALDALRELGAQPLEECGTVRSLTLKAGESYEPPHNVIFIPTLGTGRVLTSPPEPKERGTYRTIEVTLDPNLVYAPYLAEWLSGPQGRRSRELYVRGATIPHVSAKDMSHLLVLVPTLDAQNRVLEVARHLANVEATVTELRGELWRNPAGTASITARLERSTTADPDEAWADSLPFPLASILYQSIADASPRAKVERLVHFVEAFAEFASGILVSAIYRTPQVFAALRTDVAKAFGPGRTPFDRGDFGAWVNLGRTLAKGIRRVADDADLNRAWQPTKKVAPDVFAAFVDKGFWEALDQVRLIRNRRSHGGIDNPRQIQAQYHELQEALVWLRQQTVAIFDDVYLIQPGACRIRNGVYHYDQARRLMGYAPAFYEIALTTVMPLDDDGIALVGRSDPMGRVLPLVRLFRLAPAPATARNACYFYNKRVGSDIFCMCRTTSRMSQNSLSERMTSHSSSLT